MQRHGLEPPETIGDAYVCAGGSPAVHTTHAVAAAWETGRLLAEVVARNAGPIAEDFVLGPR